MSDQPFQNSKRHSGTDAFQEPELETELDNISFEEVDLVAIERAWAKRRECLKLELDGYTSNSIPSISHENLATDPFTRWYTEDTTDGFFHNVGEVRKLPKTTFRPYFRKRTQIGIRKLDSYADFESDAGATCGLLSEISRGLSRL
ncbi:hypothetical protein TWF481_006104 [Arthrobotrys musiformis]|uniref:Uncharacterized protein n=1 Tax=Arthrobotrys musiformis TaxID=47236 RepID=A0AAV9WGX2_9PEZI